MKLKTLFNKATAALLAVPFMPALAHAFQMPRAHRGDYNGMTPHAHWDAVWHETMVDITVIGVVFSLITFWFMIKYRRKGHGERGHLPKLSGQAKIGWVVIPCMLFLGDDLFLFVKGWDLHNQYREPPADAYEIKVTANMWSWTYEYPNGVETYGELKVPVGKPVVLRMHSEDVLHSHYMNRYRVTEDAMPGRVTYQWFLPDQVGDSVITCREYCGAGHSNMFGKAIVMTQADWNKWMASEVASAAPSDKSIDVAAATESSAKSIVGGKS